MTNGCRGRQAIDGIPSTCVSGGHFGGMGGHVQRRALRCVDTWQAPALAPSVRWRSDGTQPTAPINRGPTPIQNTASTVMMPGKQVVTEEAHNV